MRATAFPGHPETRCEMQPVESSGPPLPAVSHETPATKAVRTAPLELKVVVSVLTFLLAVFATVQVRRVVSPTGISRATYNRIARGMSRAEVESMLGPPGIYAKEPRAAASLPADQCLWDATAVRPPQAARWEFYNGVIWVAFDDSGHVIGKVFFGLDPDRLPRQPSLLERINSFLKQWFS
jgi:hypothetical protein